ncbi:hypothetical protein CLAFUW4_00074 [Fulvia fulva]|uniref:Uncharacterized protein n=1 Tax=Passalora fulva TaxID=5499 RepID=A0A9Q8P4G2_PASFU|nr:uncharacterized protein CLAFUR5_00072 [Fulvia fulva]KAK4634414.1 hypothetical protein CLAFUR4_00074 [Fulvia fulva]KAK4636668.1 hypothetical protein CLAFUR0_00073 [Fulvia fulva]UJO12707.1 hypothetical protein CLAFUR5_00072 [Fulvia fulva]WPV08190.1 hypothetical protein CLAFUW4_00074 [Fulvia fulva]WPV24528.1 hypothetical protein CLAFUW7_00074 [Fulvia fulva]
MASRKNAPARRERTVLIPRDGRHLEQSEWPREDVVVPLLFVHRQHLLGGNDVLARLAMEAPTEAANWRAGVYLVSIAKGRNVPNEAGQ